MDLEHKARELEKFLTQCFPDVKRTIKILDDEVQDCSPGYTVDYVHKTGSEDQYEFLALGFELLECGHDDDSILEFRAPTAEKALIGLLTMQWRTLNEERTKINRIISRVYIGK